MPSAETVYVVITPARDEAACLRLAIESMLAQTLRPAEWIIVDDGSSDATFAIVAEYARHHSWIRGLQRHDRGRRLPGTGVIETFYDGYRSLRRRDWEFLVKLDADLSFPPDFFHRALSLFAGCPHLGIAGASLYNVSKGVLYLEHSPHFHLRGAARIYRRQCWQAIGGLPLAPGWDTVDEIRAAMLQWSALTIPGLAAVHHRPTGGAGRWRDMVKRGKACYVAGYHPLYLTARCLRHLISRPYLLGSLGMATGFVSGYFGRVPTLRDAALVHYVHQQQWRRLWGAGGSWR